MSFEEFLDRRLAELLRFATVMCTGPACSDGLVTDVLVRAYPHWDALEAAGRPFVAVRAEVVRNFLAAVPVEDASGHAPIRTARVARLGYPGGLPVDVAAFASGLSSLPDHQRAALCLAVYSGQTEPEIAAVLRRPLDAVRGYLVDAGAALDAATDSGDSAPLIDLFEELGDSFELDVGAVASAVLDQLESAPPDAADPAEFEATFALSLPKVGPIGPDLLSRDEEPGELNPAPVEHWTEIGSRIAEPPPVEHWTEIGSRIAEPPPGSDEFASDGPRLKKAGSVRAICVGVVVVMTVVGVSLIVSAARHRSSPQVTRSHAFRAAVSAGAPQLNAGGPGISPLEHPLPGTKILGQYVGAGSQTIHGPRHAAAAGRVLAINGVCSGPGAATVGPATLSQCDGAAVGTGVTSAQIRSLKVRADKRTTWRFVIVDEPDSGTSGTLRYPANPSLTSGSAVTRVAQASGTGSADVALVSGATTARAENLHLTLTCTGSGVSLASEDHRFDAEYTHTCFQGWSYEFNISSAVVPEQVSVTASPDTSWQLVVTRL